MKHDVVIYDTLPKLWNRYKSIYEDQNIYRFRTVPLTTVPSVHVGLYVTMVTQFMFRFA